ncbi:2-dehydro-3-deoxygalactonokinase [Roseobacteraceae bacterium NS-SX3]
MSADSGTPDWIAADFEDGMVTLWRMQGSRVLERQEPQAAGGAEATLRECSSQAAGLPVVASGTGLCTAQRVPAKPGELPLQPAGPGCPGVYLVPGLQQPSPPALMQGAETRISGFLELNQNWDGVLCVAGNATHWVLVSAGEVVSFQSFLTVALQRAAAPIAADHGEGWDRVSLANAVQDVMGKPEMLAARLAGLQAASALQDPSGPIARGQLWGLLLGAELAAARPYWLGQNLALIAPEPLAGPYSAALEAQGLPVTVADPKRMALAGLTAAWRRLPGTGSA